MLSEDTEENESVATGEGVTTTVVEEENAVQIVSEEAEVTETANEVEESSGNNGSNEEPNSTEGQASPVIEEDVNSTENGENNPIGQEN